MPSAGICSSHTLACGSRVTASARAVRDAFAIVLADGLEDVQHEATTVRSRGVLDASRNCVRRAGAELVLDAVDHEHELAFDHVPELLVVMIVRRHTRAGLELEQVEHGAVAEERPHRDPLHECVRRRLAQPLDLAHQPASTGFVRSPIPSTDTVTTSPGFRYTGGSRKKPTPAGDPVVTTSPGSTVTRSVRNASRRAGGNSISAVAESCMTWPLSVVETRSADQSPSSSAVTISGPIGENVSGFLPSVICMSLNCTSRADTSCRIVQPRTCSSARSSGIR